MRFFVLLAFSLFFALSFKDGFFVYRYFRDIRVGIANRYNSRIAFRFL